MAVGDDLWKLIIERRMRKRNGLSITKVQAKIHAKVDAALDKGYENYLKSKLLRLVKKEEK